jgi:hypothetical protein
VRRPLRGETVHRLQARENTGSLDFGHRPRLRVINFNNKGRVTSWSYAQ